jgi:hypothetical protein
MHEVGSMAKGDSRLMSGVYPHFLIDLPLAPRHFCQDAFETSFAFSLDCTPMSCHVLAGGSSTFRGYSNAYIYVYIYIYIYIYLV